MDETDLKISELLMGNSRRTFRDLSETIGLSVNAVHKRVQSLRERGIIRAFTTKLSLSAVRAAWVMLFGQSGVDFIEGALQESFVPGDLTYWWSIGSNRSVYLGAFLRQMSDLDPYMTNVKDALQMDDIQVGIINNSYSSNWTYPPTLRESGGSPGGTPVVGVSEDLSMLDYQIIYSLSRDARKNVADVAAEIGVSAKTVKRRLAFMDRVGALEYSMEWYPDADNDIVTSFHVELKQGEEKVEASKKLTDLFGSNIIAIWNFSNLPSFLLVLTWTPTTKDVRHLRMNLEAAGFSVTPDILYNGLILDSWRDKLVKERAAPPQDQTNNNNDI